MVSQTNFYCVTASGPRGLLRSPCSKVGIQPFVYENMERTNSYMVRTPAKSFVFIISASSTIILLPRSRS